MAKIDQPDHFLFCCVPSKHPNTTTLKFVESATQFIKSHRLKVFSFQVNGRLVLSGKIFTVLQWCRVNNTRKPLSSGFKIESRNSKQFQGNIKTLEERESTIW